MPTGCSTLQALIVFNQHLFVMTAGVVRYYDQITIFPPPLLPPITAPNQFVSLIGCAARSRRTSFTTTAVILTSRMTLTFSYITLMGVQFCESASTPLHLSMKLTYDSSRSTTRQLTVQLCASYSICHILTQVCKIKFITSSRNTGPISTIKGNSSPSKITSVSSTLVRRAQSALRNPIRTTRDSYYAQMYCGPRKIRSHPSDARWQMDVQSSSCTKTPPGTRQQYCRLRVAVLY